MLELTTDMQQQIDALAAQTGVDALSARSFILFMLSAIESNPQLMDIMLSGDEKQIDALMKTGVTKWYEQSQKLGQELLEGKTARAKAMRQTILDALQRPADTPVAH